MKKITGLILKILGGIILFILILLFTVPVLFRNKIRSGVEHAIARSVNASVKFEDYHLGFFRNFPNLSFSLTGLSVTGVNKFEGDTLAAVRSFDLVFDLSSLFKKSGYEVKSVLINGARVNAIVLKDGSANWDIAKDTTQTSAGNKKEEAPSNLRILLQKVSITNSSLTYSDAELTMQAILNGLNLGMKGDMTAGKTDMQLEGKISEFTFIMDGMKYLNKAVIDSRIDLIANLDSMRFTFRDNWLSVNDLKMNFAGVVSMPGDNIETDISFKTMQTSFSSLLSLIPAVYMKDYKDLRTNGEFSLAGTAKGTYSSADSTMPDVSLSLSVVDASLSYPSLPEQIKNINITSELFVDGTNADKSTVEVDRFHMELSGSPFDMNFSLKTPISDPDFKGSASGKIDLAALSKALPLDSMNLAGIIDVSASMAGKMSMIEKGNYENFKASGKLGVRDMLVAMKGYPEIKIGQAGFDFTPAYVALTDARLNVGKSDFQLKGRLANYIPYIFRNQTLRGNMSMYSKLTDVSGIMSETRTDTTTATDTSSSSLIKVPGNIDFDFDALIDELRYGNITGQKVKGHLIVRNGILSIKQTGMNIMDGTMELNADYDTRDTLKPQMKADMEFKGISVKDAFTTFNSVRMLAPAAKGIDGKVSMKFGFQSLLENDLMPVVSSISGEGKLTSDAITLVNSETFDKVKSILKLGDNYSNTFRNINISFRINDGRIYVSPFDVRTGNLKMNISGDQGIDQTLNYLVKTEMPRADLGSSVNSLIDNLAAQASAFGISFKPSDVIKINLKVTGTFTNPAIAPVFGNASDAGSAGSEPVVKEAAKEAVGAAREKARAEAEKQAAQLVREAEEKGQQLRDEAARAAESLRKEADAKAKKIVDDSAGKSPLEKMAAEQSAQAIRKGADKKATQLVNEADVQAKKLVEDAKTKGEELIKKI